MKKEIGKGVPKQPLAEKTAADNSILFIFLCYALIEFMPSFNCREHVMPQYLYLTFLNTIVLFYGRARDLYPIYLFNFLKNSWLVRMYMAFFVLCGLSIVVARNFSLSVVAIAQIGVLVSALINLLALFYHRLHLIKKVAFMLALIAILQALYALLAFNHYSFLEALSSNDFKGSTDNINIFSMSFLIKIPLIFIAIIQTSDYKKWIFSLSLGLSALVIFLINARASLLAIILISIIFFIYYLKIEGFKRVAFLNALYVYLPILLALGTANMIFKSSGIVQSRWSSTASRFTAASNDGSINMRLMYWKNALKMTQKHPFLGIGLNNWKVESIPYEPLQEKILSGHTHNDFLQFFAETGVVNGCIYLCIFFTIFVINLKRLLKAESPQSQTIAVVALMMLIVFGIDSTFNFPFLFPVVHVQFFLCIVFTLLNTHIERLPHLSQNKLVLYGLIIMAILPLYVNYRVLKTAQLERLIIEKDIEFTKTKSTLNMPTGDEVIAGRPFYPNVMADALIPFVEYASSLYLQEKKIEKSKLHLDEAISINPYFGSGYFLKAYGAANNGLVDSAYYYIKKAMAIRPNNTRNLNFALQLAEIKKDTAGALKFYNQVSKLIKRPDYWMDTYTVLNNMGYKNIDRFLKQGFQDFPKDSTVSSLKTQIVVNRCLSIAKKQFEQKQYSAVFATCNAGLKEAPANVYILQDMGFYALNLGKFEDAIRYLEQAVGKPGLTDGKAEYCLGYLYMRANDHTQACKYLAIASARKYPDEMMLYNKCIM
ncbi:hypothetical protein DHW03_16300 [Pedobacter yonginense]|uniref:O-antigen ligase-related domain-containing protein n=1 Tax=Pedobacter yonginense TaxID=651869 RepID=A0A317EHQ5_9SPHI|nr:O-antigen ligase family protein [Pedobacter yonginense]PWS26341.1 hypothetical protein DHW03_16300 [Pedobacter yonginense]